MCVPLECRQNSVALTPHSLLSGHWENTHDFATKRCIFCLLNLSSNTISLFHLDAQIHSQFDKVVPYVRACVHAYNNILRSARISASKVLNGSISSLSPISLSVPLWPTEAKRCLKGATRLNVHRYSRDARTLQYTHTHSLNVCTSSLEDRLPLANSIRLHASSK